MNQEDREKITSKANLMYLAGEVVARLHKAGLSLPSNAIFDLSNYGQDKEGAVKLSTLATMERLGVINSPPSALSSEQRVEILLLAAVMVLKPWWDAFAAGYRDESRELGQSEAAESALAVMEPKLTLVHEAKILHARSMKLFKEGKHLESIQLLEQEIDQYRQAGLEMLAGRVYINMGTAFSSVEDEEQGLHCYLTAYDIAQRYGDSYSLLLACVSLASLYAAREDALTAQKYADEGLRELRQAGIPPADVKNLQDVLEKYGQDPYSESNH